MKIIDQLRDLRSLDSSPEEEMKRFILSLASELRLDEGHALPPNVLMHRTINLNPKQRDALVPALEKLVEEGVFKETEDGRVLLTAQGKDVLY